MGDGRAIAYAGAQRADPERYRVTEADAGSGVTDAEGEEMPLIARHSHVRDCLDVARANARAQKLNGMGAAKYTDVMRAECDAGVAERGLTFSAILAEVLERRYEVSAGAQAGGSGSGRAPPRGGRKSAKRGRSAEEESSTEESESSDSETEDEEPRRRGNKARRPAKKTAKGGAARRSPGGVDDRLAGVCHAWAKKKVTGKGPGCAKGTKCKYEHGWGGTKHPKRVVERAARKAWG